MDLSEIIFTVKINTKLDNRQGNLSIKITLYENNLEQQQNPVYVTYLGTQGLELHHQTITGNNKLCYDIQNA